MPLSKSLLVGAALTLVIGVALFHVRNSTSVETFSEPTQVGKNVLHKEIPAHRDGIQTKSSDGEEAVALPSKKALRDFPQAAVPSFTPSLHSIGWEDVPTAQIDSFAPGNRLPVNKHTVEVQGYKSTPQGNALVVVVTPASAVEEVPAETTLNATAESVSATVIHSTSRAGFTPEEELFRTKWGWAAFAQAQREAALHPDDTP